MKKIFLPLALLLSLSTFAIAAEFQGDTDDNDALDIAAGGTNATTAAAARTNLDVYSKAEADAADGTGTDDQDASEVSTSTANFDGNLSASDTTVQAALETLDDMTASGGVTDGDKGDITVSGSGTTWSLDNDSVGAAEIGTNAVGADEINADQINPAHLDPGQDWGELDFTHVFTIADGVIDAANLDATNSPTDDYIPSYDLASGGFTWVANTAGGTDDQTITDFSLTGDTLSITLESDVGGAHTVDLSGYQSASANLDTYASIAPSANMQAILAAADYAAMRGLLDLEIGTDIQAYNANLTTYAGIAPSANVQSMLGAATYAAIRTLLDLEVGVDFNAYDSNMISWPSAISATEVSVLDGITRSGNDITVPGSIITTASDGSRKLKVDANTVAVSPTVSSFELYPDSDNRWKMNNNGTESEIVGDTDTQTLTNKDLSSGNTFPTFNQNTTGNAATATALAANGGNCSAGSYPLGVDENGAVESCTDATTEIDSAISTERSASATLTNKTIDVASNTISSFPETFCVAASDETTDLTTGTAKITFRMPWPLTLTAVRASVGTAPVGSTLNVDVNEGGTSIFSTVLTIDAGEKTSTTAATAAVISDSSLADDGEITIDIDQIGSSTAGAGLKVCLLGTRSI